MRFRNVKAIRRRGGYMKIINRTYVLIMSAGILMSLASVPIFGSMVFMGTSLFEKIMMGFLAICGLIAPIGVFGKLKL